VLVLTLAGKKDEEKIKTKRKRKITETRKGKTGEEKIKRGEDVIRKERIEIVCIIYC